MNSAKFDENLMLILFRRGLIDTDPKIKKVTLKALLADFNFAKDQSFVFNEVPKYIQEGYIFKSAKKLNLSEFTKNQHLIIKFFKSFGEIPGDQIL